MALADADDTLNFSAGLTEQHDSNLFRLAAGVDPLPLVGKSARADSISIGTVGLSLKKAYSLQQFEASLEHVANRYATYSFLNYDADNARAAWRWHFTPRLSGNLTYGRNQAMIGFGDYRNFNQLNVRTITTTRFDADWNLFHNGWHLRGGVDQYTTRNSQTFTQDEGSRVAGADIGVRYVFPSSSRIDLLSRVSQGSLTRTLNPLAQLDDGFRERRDELRLYWLVTGKSIIEGSLGVLTRDYDHYASRDYSGGIGSLKWTWVPTGKLALELSWKRDLAAYTDATASYYLQDAFSVGPVWQVSNKVKLSFKLDRIERDYRGPITLVPFGARNDKLDTAQLLAEWAPFRAIAVTGFLNGDRRAANQPGLNYSALVAGANVRLEF